MPNKTYINSDITFTLFPESSNSLNNCEPELRYLNSGYKDK